MIEVEEMTNLYRDEFETVFGVKKNIQALRDKVLDLAIKGKLVEQDPDDEPASELLIKIQSEKEQLIRKKEIKKDKTNDEIDGKDIPFAIPQSWEWAKLGDIATVKGGKRIPKGFTYATADTEHVYLRVTDMKNGTIDLSGLRYISNEVHEKIKNYTISTEDLYITVAGTIGNVGTIPEDVNNMNLTENANKIRPLLIEKRYLKYVLSSPFVQNAMKEKVNQMAQPKLSIRSIQDIILPIAPLEEQSRIVNKTELLLKQIDQLEEQLEQKEKLEVLIPKAVVTALSNSQDEEELKKNLALVIENFTDVFQTPESLEEFRGVILQLAFQGKLMPQNHSDETANKLVNHIMKIRKEEKMKSKFEVIASEEVPFMIPDSWKWIRLGELTTNFGQKKPMEKFSYIDVSSIDNKNGCIGQDVAVLEPENAPSRARKVVGRGSVIYSTVRPYLLNVAVVDKEIEPEPIVSTAFSVLKPLGGFSEYFLYYYLRSDIFTEYVEDKMVGLAYPAINDKNLQLGLVPVPPLEEQKRIVAKIESLFAVVDQLEEEMKRRERIVEAMAVI